MRLSARAFSKRDFNNRAGLGRPSFVVELESVTVVGFRVRRFIVTILEPVVIASNFVDVVGAFISFLQLQGHVSSDHVLPDEYKIPNFKWFQEVRVIIMCFLLPILCALDKLLCLGTKASDSVKFGLCVIFGCLCKISFLKRMTQLVSMQKFGWGKPS